MGRSSRGRARTRAAASRRRQVARFGRERLFIVGTLMLLMLLGVMATGPYADYTAAQERVVALEDRQAALGAAVETLEAEAERLEDPAALEEQARSQLGMVRPGEIPYIVVNPPTEAPEPVNANPEPAGDAEVEGPSVLDRVLDWVTGLATR